MAQIWRCTISVQVLCYVSAFVPKHTLPSWFYSFVSHFWKNWYGYNIFFLNLLLQFLQNFIRVTRCWGYAFINYVFRSAFFLQRTIFFFCTVSWLLMMVASINKFLVVWFDNISHILCATVAYLHIIPIETFMELVEGGKCRSIVEGTSLQRL